MDTLANSEDPDEMQHNAVFQQGLHCLLRQIQSSGILVHNHLEMYTCDPLKYKMVNPILLVFISVEKYIRMQRVK